MHIPVSSYVPPLIDLFDKNKSTYKTAILPYSLILKDKNTKKRKAFFIVACNKCPSNLKHLNTTDNQVLWIKCATVTLMLVLFKG